ncbi:MAG: hypothetical protein C5B58_03385, partial [Acidobacteria bacterium]
GDWNARHGRGLALKLQGRYAEAVRAYLEIIDANPLFHKANNDLAWLLATCPNEAARDGRRAIEYATAACEQTGWKNSTYIDTLAAAYAESGQFEEALRYQALTLEDPVLQGDRRTVARQRLELYRQKKPFRE